MVPTDARDNQIMFTALEDGADYIVTEDARDLLSLKVIKVRGFPPIQVVDASSFVRQLSRR
jgi:predicted nucleic acid-binding protein